MRILVLGGNRFIGAELVRLAVAHGHLISVLSTEEPADKNVRWIRANRNKELRKPLRNLEFDVVIDNIAYRPADVESLIETLKGRICRYVLTSSVDIYCNGAPQPCDERIDECLHPFLCGADLPESELYIRGKRGCEIALRAREDLESVVIRPAVAVGIRDHVVRPRALGVSRSLFFPTRLIDGKPILLRHEDTRVYQTVFVGDVANALLTAATHPLAANGVFNVVGDETWTNEKLIATLGAVTGRRSEILRVSQCELRGAGLADYVTPYSQSTIHRWPLFANGRLKSLGWRPTKVEKWGASLFSDSVCSTSYAAARRANEIALAKTLARQGSRLATIPIGVGHRSMSSKRLSAIGIGTYRGAPTECDDRAYLRSIKRAVRGGINVIDTAISYRDMRSERVVGIAVRQLVKEGIKREELTICTKGGYVPSVLLRSGLLSREEVKRRHCISAGYLAVSLEESVRNLGLDHIDVYLLHNPENSLDRRDPGRFYGNLIETFAMLEQRVSQGLIGAYGLATWNAFRTPADHAHHIDMQRAVECAKLATRGSSHFKVIELPLNPSMPEASTLLAQTIEGRPVSALEAAALNQISIFTSRSVMQGAFDASTARSLVDRHASVCTALIGMRRAAHVDAAKRALANN